VPVVVLCFGVLVSVVVISISSQFDSGTRVFALYALLVLQLVFGTIGFLFLSRRRSHDARGAAGSPKDTFGKLSVVALTLCLMLALTFALMERAETVPYPGWPLFIWKTFYFFVLIGFTEELIFRGIPGEIFPQKPLKALLWGALLFAIYHLNNGLHSLPYYFAVGLVFGVLRQFGVSLVALAAMHGIFNIVVDLAWPMTGFRFGEVAFFVVAPLVLFAIAALAGWLLSLQTAARPHMTKSEKIAEDVTKPVRSDAGTSINQLQPPAGQSKRASWH
jgi:membrane protease YdiL (CAAX protease family)